MPFVCFVILAIVLFSRNNTCGLAQEKSGVESELKHVQARFERLQTVHTKACERRAGLDVQNKKLCAQVEALQTELQQASQSKLEHQEKLKRTASELKSMKQSVEQTIHDRKLCLSQLWSAEKIAQDSRSALVKVQARCDELSRALASVQSQAETLKQEKVSVETCMSERCLELRAAQESLKACEEDLRLSRCRKVDGRQEDDKLIQAVRHPTIQCTGTAGSSVM